MSTPISGPDSTPTPSQPAPTTWLCTFSVTVDLPVTMSVDEMEAVVAQAAANHLTSLGLPGNVVVQLMATAGNTTVLDSGAAATIGAGPDAGAPIIGSPV